ncbi:MAG: amidohydrolase [Peptoniphilus sp.]|uniref:amidohydrolase n=1 Tax=Peptoniphilus sp. TaxID=1971214 RepID=UPI0025E0CFB0|nr:amidohydrolase [Peptoniphilus sp.]MCI5643144.1 amidohydrolase [Peptoniphilus sp.]MDD7352271.1 amidohydrolase [Peptoniphilaceae bacterium]MDY3902913.1 amidohydrolase [Peptoniphilus sp.]
MNVKNLIEKNKDYIIEMRRYFHMHPELSFEEFETTKKIAEELEKMGIPYEIPTEEPKTGVIGVIKGGKPGKTVALRADIDALNVTEKNDVEYKSQNVGKMHACGHDTHMAMLLGAAKMLKEVQNDLCGRVYLIFQPAEEVGLGAKYMMRQGNWFEETDNIYGSHIWSGVEAGKISVEAGDRMAAADLFKIKIKGKSGHGSMPNETIDAVVTGSAVVQALQQLVSRNYSPLDSVTVTIGSFHSGNRFNIIAGEAEMEGTNRYFSREVGERIENDMRRVIKGVCDAYGATYELEYTYILGPTINEEKSSHIAEKAIEKFAGKDAVALMQKTTGGEDFAFYLEKKPGCFGFVGCRNPLVGADFPHHSERFNVDESVLANGAATYAQYAIDFLNGED